MSKIDYRAFIEDNFTITTTEGVLVPFKFNDIQNYYYDLLIKDYSEELSGIRENILKSRRFGFSSIIDAMFVVDFILSELGAIPLTNSDVYSYKDKDTQVLFTRVNQFLDSYLLKDQGYDYKDLSHRKHIPTLRKAFLKTDVSGTAIIGKNGAEYHCLTAGAKVSGRGGTKQNIHWSEVAFYGNTAILNARDLVTGAEEQVSSGIGKIFRETTGNVADDYFSSEYYMGKDGVSDFKSRFLAWHLFGAYRKPAPEDWTPPEYYDAIIREGVDKDQCYWHYEKTRGLTDKRRLREYPTSDTEAFLLGGEPFFDAEALLWYTNNTKKTIRRADYALSLS
jgi:hypothetical protein